jgi:hypothetical protein
MDPMAYQFAETDERIYMLHDWKYMYMRTYVHTHIFWNILHFVLKVEWNLNPLYSGSSWSDAPAVSDEKNAKFSGWELAEETETVWVNQPQCHFVRHMDSPGIESGSSRRGAANKHLSYGTA